MDTETQAQRQSVPGYYFWSAAGSPVEIYLRLDVIDRLAAEAMRGYGKVPKRGAEIGGLLLGTVERGETPVVRVEDFEVVTCDYKRGPSYLFTDDDAAAFDEAWVQRQPGESAETYAVGFFRSHTRERMGLSPEDIDLIGQYFPAPEAVVLLVKPFATRVSAAGFFVRQDGAFPDQSPLEFPLNRRALMGDAPPPRRPLGPRRIREPEPVGAPPPSRESEPEPAVEPEPATSRSRTRTGWVWIPLSFIFLLVGVLLGIQAALTMAPKATGPKVEDFTLALAVTKTGENLTVKWNRDAPAVREASKGVLEIEDGGFAKPVDLDSAHLQGGSVIYRNSSDRVRFRLSVYLNAKLTVTETLEWRQ